MLLCRTSQHLDLICAFLNVFLGALVCNWGFFIQSRLDFSELCIAFVRPSFVGIRRLHRSVCFQEEIRKINTECKIAGEIPLIVDTLETFQGRRGRGGHTCDVGDFRAIQKGSRYI